MSLSRKNYDPAIMVGAVDSDTPGGISLTNGQILVGNASGVAADVAVSGDVTIANTGAVTIANNAVTGAKMANNTVTSTQLDIGVIQVATVNVSAADIVTAGTTMKQLVAAPGAGKYIELISATISYAYSTAAYTLGGNTTIALGTTAITGLISAAACFGKASSAVIQFNPLAAAATDLSTLTNTALNINVAAAFTNPGTAAGTAKVYVAYRVLTA